MTIVPVAPLMRAAVSLFAIGLVGCSSPPPAPPPGPPTTRDAGERDAEPPLEAPIDVRSEPRPRPNTGATAAFFEDVSHWLVPGFTREVDPNGEQVADRVFSSVCVLEVGRDRTMALFFAARRWSSLYVRGADGRFYDETEERGLVPVGDALTCLAVDDDGDGDDDLWLPGVNGVRHFLSVDDRFEEAPPPLGELAREGSVWGPAAAYDVDADGDLDLLLGGWSRPAEDDAPPLPVPVQPIRNWLLLADGGGAYEDATERLAPALLTPQLTNVAAFVDVDDDGVPEILIGDDYGLSGGSNLLLVRQPDGVFRDRGVELGFANAASSWGISAMGLAAGDVDGDGRLDYVVSDEPAHATVLHRCGGIVCADEGPERGTDASLGSFRWGEALIDVDLDGDLDLVEATGHFLSTAELEATGTGDGSPIGFRSGAELQSTNLLLNTGQGVFAPPELSSSPLLTATNSRGLARADLDDDGAVDVVLGARSGSPQLLRGVQRAGGHALTVRLVGTGANRAAVGAVVRLRSGDRVWTRPRLAGGLGFAGNHDHRLFFGLGEVSKVDVEVRWPDGQISVLTEVDADQELTIERL